jgi:beta-galactosidase
MKHMVAMTNCDLVKLYLNDDLPREMKPDQSGDGMAHFWVPYIPGLVRAEGWRNNEKVIEDVLHTAKQAATVEIIAPVKASPEEIVPIEIWLKDKWGEAWVLDNPVAEVQIRGNAKLIAMDNGDLSSPEVYATSRRSFWNGHIMAFIQIGKSGEAVTVTVETQNMNSVSREISITEKEG